MENGVHLPSTLRGESFFSSRLDVDSLARSIEQNLINS